MAKLLVYDGDCPLCWWISQRFVDLGLVDDRQRRPFQSFGGERKHAMEEAGIRNEMLVLDEGSEEIRTGIDGFLWLLEDSRWSGLAGPLGIAPARGLLRFGYRAIAYNRRVLAPPRKGIVCECDPDPHLGFRIVFLFVASLVTLGSVSLVGVAVRRAFGIGGALLATRVALGLYALVLVLERTASRSTWFRSAGNALMVLLVAGLGALPASGLSLLVGGAVSRPLVLVGIGAAVWLGGRSLGRRLSRPGSEPPSAGDGSLG